MTREDETAERTTVSLPAGLASKLSYEARRSHRSASSIVREALMAYFAERSEDGSPSFIGIGSSGSLPPVGDQVDDEIARIMDERFDEIMGRASATTTKTKRKAASKRRRPG